MSTRAQWATDRLSAWLQESETGAALYLLEQIREAVEHWTECDGMDRTCAGIADECADNPDPQDCEHCATPCEECQNHRAGYGTGTWATRRALDVVADLEKLLEARDLERAS